MTTIKDISDWFDEGKERGAKFMIIACDTFNYEDYPIFCNTKKEFDDTCSKLYRRENMQCLMETYDLSKDKNSQLNNKRNYV